MKKSTLRLLAVLAVASALVLLPTPPRLSATSSGTPALPGTTVAPATGSTSALYQKDETVYALLGPNGAVQSIEVVNRLYGEPGLWIDPGVYASVVNLSSGAATVLMPDSVHMESPDGENLYYQGTMASSVPLPFLVKINYALDRVPVTASELAGTSGEVAITIAISPNPDADAAFQDRFVLQTNLSLDLQHARNIVSPGATRMTAGRSSILAYTLLPGQSAVYKLSFTALDFRMSAITMTALPMQDGSAGMSELTGGLDSLRGGAAGLAGAGVELSEGLAALSAGLVSLDNGLLATSNGLAALSGGMAAGLAGGETLASQTAAIASGAAALAPALSALATQSEQLSNGYAQLTGTLSSLTVPAEQQAILAISLAQLGELNAGLQATVSGLQSIDAQFTPLAAGIAQLAAGMTDYNAGLGEVNGGLTDAATGIRTLSDAAASIAGNASGLPGGAATIAAGQQSLADGLSTLQSAVGRLIGGSDTPLTSFAAPGRFSPNSLQFLLHTPAIEAATAVPDAPKEDLDEAGFIEKLVALFR